MCLTVLNYISNFQSEEPMETEKMEPIESSVRELEKLSLKDNLTVMDHGNNEVEKDEKVPLATGAVLTEDALSPFNYKPVIKLAKLAAIAHKKVNVARKTYHGVLPQRLITKKDGEGNRGIHVCLSAVRKIHSEKGSRQGVISAKKVCYFFLILWSTMCLTALYFISNFQSEEPMETGKMEPIESSVRELEKLSIKDNFAAMDHGNNDVEIIAVVLKGTHVNIN